MPGGLEDVEDVRGADEAGGDVIIPLFNVADQFTDRDGAGRCVDKAEVECEDVGGLRAGGDETFRGDETPAESGDDFFVEGAILLRISGLAEEVGDLGHERGVVGVVGGADQIVGRDAIGPAAAIEGEPVAEAAPRDDIGMIADVIAATSFGDELHEELHRGVVLGEDFAVAVTEINRPGTDDGSVGPGGTAVAAFVAGFPVGGGDDAGDAAVGLLGVAHILHPFVEEAADIHVEGGGAAEDLGVAGPAEALVALGAIGGHLEEIAFLAPDDVVLKLIERLVRAAEAAGGRRVGMKHDAGDFARIDPAEVLNLDVAEAVEGEARFPDLRVAAFAGVEIGAAGVAKIFGVNGAVGIEDLSEPEAQGRAGRSLDGEADTAGEILAEIEEAHAVPVLALGNGDDLAHAAHGGADAGDELDGMIGRADDDGLPAAVIVTGLRPGAELQAGIVGLAVEEIAFKNRAGGGFPRSIGAEGERGAILQNDFETGEEVGTIPVDLAAKPADGAAVPAVAEDGAERILALSQKRGDIVGLVLDALLIIGPAGGEDFISDASAIDLAFVETERGDDELGGADGLIEPE